MAPVPPAVAKPLARSGMPSSSKSPVVELSARVWLPCTSALSPVYRVADALALAEIEVRGEMAPRRVAWRLDGLGKGNAR